jgi:4'-phosphopantetheinyl transferase
MTLTLDSQRIDLWCTFFGELGDERLLRRYRALLDDHERHRETRFHFARDRCCYLVTRALVRTVLSRYADIAPEDWVFSTSKYGRPEIANAHSDAQGISFNITHTHSLIMVGVTREYAIGVDSENLVASRMSMDVADRFFSHEEIATLRGLRGDRQSQRLLEYWTLKESYIKAKGMGLAIPLDRISFRFAREDRVEISMAPELSDTPAQWRFWQFRLRSEYLAAICAQCVRDKPPLWTLREVIPLISERMLEHTLVRKSD